MKILHQDKKQMFSRFYNLSMKDEESSHNGEQMHIFKIYRLMNRNLYALFR